MAGARHILQQQVLRGLPPPQSIEPAPPRAKNLFVGNAPEFMQNLFNNNLTTLGLEFMKHGDVWKLLERAGSHPKTWRSQELWLIWHCREYLAIFLSFELPVPYLIEVQSSEDALHWPIQTSGTEDATLCSRTLYYKKKRYPSSMDRQIITMVAWFISI